LASDLISRYLGSSATAAIEIKLRTESSASFVDSVLSLAPRVAAFDCDGTLWSGDVGEGFFTWELKRGIVSEAIATSMRARYADYKAGRVSEDDMCGEMVTMHQGMPESALLRATGDYFEHSFPGHIFPEMRELVERLQQKGCDVWAVSSSNEWLIRAGMKHFGIPDNRLLAASVEIDDGIITDRIVRLPSGPGKPRALRDADAKDIDAAFGNSRWDTEMLAMAKHSFAVNPNPDLEAIARQRNWTVYFPDGTKHE
jgi:HAD superfamily phosphoserine phosphatase-like hydrolase